MTVENTENTENAENTEKIEETEKIANIENAGRASTGADLTSSKTARQEDRTRPGPELAYQLRRVERDYSRGGTLVRAVRTLDLDITAGEIVALEGPSGSGKSTLLQLVGCLEVPTSGQIHFFEESSATSRTGSSRLSAARTSALSSSNST